MTTATAPEPSAPAAPTPPPSDAPKPVYAVGRLSVVVNRERLAEALSMAAAVANKRTNNPALACCRITTGENDIAVEATNMEAAVVTVITEVQIESAGAVLVSIDKLQQIVNEHSEDTLAFSVEDKGGVPTLYVRGNESEFKLLLADLSKFPESAPAADNQAVTVHATTLARLIRQSEVAASDNETYGCMRGIQLECDGKSLSACGTDGRRIALAKTPAPDDAKWPKLLAVIPSPALKIVKGLLAMLGDETLSVSVDGSRIVFDADDIVITHVTLEGQFPDYAGALKRGASGIKGKLTAEREAVIGAVRKANLMANEREGLPDLKCEFGPAGLELGGSDSMFGEGAVRLPCKVEGGLVTHLNPRFLLDGLKSTNAAEAVIELPDSHKMPVFIRDGDAFTYMLMPTNVK
jgi:DNA polymerase-3 subunit beta